MKNKCLMFSLGNSNRPIIQGRVQGAYRIAHLMRELDWDVEVIDFFYWWELEELKNICRTRIDSNTKLIGFSQLWTDWPETAEQLTTWIKETYPDVTIVFGTAIYQDLNTKNVDWYFKGYSENAFTAWLAWKFSNGLPVNYETVNGQKVVLSDRDYPAFPYRNPIVLYEDRDFIQPYEGLGIEFSRGCKFACDFCNFPMLNVKGDYTRDAKNFEIQIRDAYDRFGVTKYNVVDETFNDRLDKITKFADVVETLPFKPYFAGYVRPDLLCARPRDKEELARLGFAGHYYGVESFNHEANKTIGKGMRREKLEEGLLEAKNYFLKHNNGVYRGSISLIGGLPNETEESVWQSYLWLEKNWSDQAYVMFPLVINQMPKYYKPELTKLSKFELDWRSYGYEEMSAEEVDAVRGELVDRMLLRRGLIYWKNKHTNYHRQLELSNKMLARGKEKGIPFAWNSWTTLGDLSGDPIEETMKKDKSFDMASYSPPFFEKYKNLKLNYQG